MKLVQNEVVQSIVYNFVKIAALLNAEFDFGRLISGRMRSRERLLKSQFLAQYSDFFIRVKNVNIRKFFSSA